MSIYPYYVTIVIIYICDYCYDYTNMTLSLLYHHISITLSLEVRSSCARRCSACAYPQSTRRTPRSLNL